VNRLALAILTILTLSGESRPSATDSFAHGELTDPVSCAAAPDQSYTLFLPSSYDPEKRWPVLYALDARARGSLPAGLFQSAAEELGWIIVSSNNSMSDDSMTVIVDAMKAIWTDSHERLSIDDRRVYVAGFSGTARFATLAHLLVPVRGVIGVGAGFVPDAPIPTTLPWAYYATAGYEDFNYYELYALDERLDSISGFHRIEYFDGIHSWPPEEICSRALEWMQIQAMKQELIPRDEALIQRSLRGQLQNAQADEANGRLADAFLIYEGVTEDYSGLDVDLSEVVKKVETLASLRAVQATLDDRRRRNETDLRIIAEARRRLSAAVAPQSGLVHSPDLIRDIGIARLKKQANDPRRLDEARSARRILATLFVQTAFYMPQALFDRGDGKRAIISLEVADSIRVDDPSVHLGLARANALAGNRKRALREIDRAVELGIRDARVIGSQPEFESLRDDPRFAELLSRLEAASTANR